MLGPSCCPQQWHIISLQSSLTHYNEPQQKWSKCLKPFYYHVYESAEIQHLVCQLLHALTQMYSYMLDKCILHWQLPTFSRTLATVHACPSWKRPIIHTIMERCQDHWWHTVVNVMQSIHRNLWHTKLGFHIDILISLIVMIWIPEHCLQVFDLIQAADMFNYNVGSPQNR